LTRETPLWLQAGSYPASVDRRLLGALWPTADVVGCAVTVAAAMTVNVAAGLVAVPTATNTGSVLCSSTATEEVTLAVAPASGSNRIDLVVCQARGNDLDGGANNDFVFAAVTGTASASPAVPAVPNNAVALAQVFVAGGSAAVTAGNITDRRWITQGPGTCLRQASNPNAGNPSCAAEAAISFLATPPLYVPTATQLVTVRTSWRQSSGFGGEGCFVRIREGTTTAGLCINDCVGIFATGGPQVGTSPGGQVSRTYAPGIGVKQWVLTLASTTVNGVSLVNGAQQPIVLEVIDAGG
jgi:hypothetical protein